MRRWWRIGLTAQQIETLQIEARALCDVNGPVAQKVILDRAQSLGKRHGREAMRLSRLAACIADQMKESSTERATSNHVGNDPERLERGRRQLEPAPPPHEADMKGG